MRGTETIGANPVLDFGIDRNALGYVGHELQRPECILAESDGALWVADARGGVVRIQGGEQRIITQRRSEHFDRAGSEAVQAHRPGTRVPTAFSGTAASSRTRLRALARSPGRA